MDLSDEIFPAPPAGNPKVLRLNLVDSWESQFQGLGRLTSFLTPRLGEESFAGDDIGLYVVFLQRHRVEVGLKLIIERTGEKIPPIHSINRLFDHCELACEAAGISAWRQFAKEQREFVRLMDQVDPGAATFRYPVNQKARAWGRKPLVDIESLERAGEAFGVSVDLLIVELSQVEALPVGQENARETVDSLIAVVRSSRSIASFQREMMADLKSQRDRLSTSKKRRSSGADGAEQAAESVFEVSEMLAVRAEALAERINNEFETGLPEPPAVHRSAMPQIAFSLGQTERRAQLDALIEWYAEGIASEIRSLGRALKELETRSSSWTEPAARQVFLDASRLRSRIHRTMSE